MLVLYMRPRSVSCGVRASSTVRLGPDSKRTVAVGSDAALSGSAGQLGFAGFGTSWGASTVVTPEGRGGTANTVAVPALADVGSAGAR
jgi:hypothetical protein